MKIAIMQPYLFPYIGYFQLINLVDKFIFYDDVNFINKGWINRNNIGVNGKPNLFTIPLKEASQNKLINEIEILQDEKWQIRFLKTIEQNYKKAPQFHAVYPLITEIINQKERNISNFIFYSTKLICDYLDIKTTLIQSSTIYQNTNLKAQERILDICIQEKASQYINPQGGTELYDKTFFENRNIQLNFLKSFPTIYPQFSTTFLPYLSIIDVLMFNKKSTINDHLVSFELI
jgi:WbqC-like protein family